MAKKRGNEKTILIIEDEPDIQLLASYILEMEGYNIIRVGSAEDGLELARKKEITAVLLDLHLPGRDGWWLLDEMKKDEKLSLVPVVIFTATAEVSQRDRALRMGAADYLVKPLSASEITEAISHAAGKCCEEG